MLSDLLSLEQIYGRTGAILYLDEILGKYEDTELQKTLENGDIITRTICIGPDCGRVICWLSDQGRCKAVCV